MNQAEIQEADAAASLAAFERQRIQAENLVSILLGRNHGTITRGAALQEQVLTPDVPAGLPAQLLERRPDIRAAETRRREVLRRRGLRERRGTKQSGCNYE